LGASQNYDMDKDIRVVLATNLRRAGQAKGIGERGLQSWLEKQTGVSQGYLSKLFSEEPPYCSIGVLAELASGLGMQPWELLVDEPAVRAAALKRMLDPQ
jgi:hypothetical protein